MTLEIKRISEAHLKAVKFIEKSCFPIPWNSKIFDTLASWSGRLMLDVGKIICMDVVEEEEEPAGYVVWEENRRTLLGRIMNLAVRQNSRRKGLGKILLTHALEAQKVNGLKRCELEVRESNSPAKYLYEHVGMRIIGRESGYYETEDALIYSIEL